MTLRTLNDIFFAVVERNHDRLMLHRRGGDWMPLSSQELYRNVVGVARAFKDWGIAKGDRVAILSENRPEWPIADFACFLLGAVVVPIYATLTGEQAASMLSDSGARILMVSTESQLSKILPFLNHTSIEKVVVMDSVENAQAFLMQPLMHAGPSGRDSRLDACARSIAPEDLATIIYTSGTTGVSKGVMLTHRNLASNIACSLEGFDMRPGDTSVSFLPLSHVTARHVDLALLYHGVTLAYCPMIEQLPHALLEVRPTIFVAVPRVYEKIYVQVGHRTKKFPKNIIYQWALSVGRAHKPEILAGKLPTSLIWKLADKLVYSQVRTALGGCIRIFISGGAPLGRELADWYATVGIRIHEGYGLTETSPVIAVNTPRAHKLGTVGKPLLNLEVRIAEDGEVLVRGPSVFIGYWNRPEETKNACVDGWFKTGDIGRIDDDGFLSITDRKKDLIKTSGGKFIAPQPIESCVKLNYLVGTAVVVGDRRKFPAIIISPHFPALEEWAHANNVVFSSRRELVANAKVQALYEEIVADANNKLARFEKLKKVLVVPDEFSADNGTLTHTMKLRRRIVEERYRELIEEMYDSAEKLASGSGVSD
jgi:long-chain acyl-CoA synthetase